MVFLLILLYLTIGFVFACINCAIQRTPTPPEMSEEDKNMFVLIVALWAILFPFKFVRRLYIAIRASLTKGKVMLTKDYKVGDRVFYETYLDKVICTDIVKRVKIEHYIDDKGKEIPYKWLTLWESEHCSSGIEDYNCLSYNDPRVKDFVKKFKKFDKEKNAIIDSIIQMISPYGKLAQIEILDTLKIKLNIE